MSKTILLADDSVTIQKVVELTFMDEDYDIVSVSSGDQAVDRLDDLSPALVIADVHMPGASGYEVCRRAKEAFPQVPVLLLVGTFEEFDDDEAAACGADRHLKKPFDSQELTRLVEELLEGEAPAPSGVAAEAEEGPMTSWQMPALDLSAPSIELGETMDLSHAAEHLRGEDEEAQDEEAGPADDGGEEPLEEAAGDEEALAEPAAAAPEAAPAAVSLSDADVDRIARRVVELLGDQTVREVSWEVIPDLAEVIIKDRVRELESQVD